MSVSFIFITIIFISLIVDIKVILLVDDGLTGITQNSLVQNGLTQNLADLEVLFQHNSDFLVVLFFALWVWNCSRGKESEKQIRHSSIS